MPLLGHPSIWPTRVNTRCVRGTQYLFDGLSDEQAGEIGISLLPARRQHCTTRPRPGVTVTRRADGLLNVRVLADHGAIEHDLDFQVFLRRVLGEEAGRRDTRFSSLA